MANERKGRGSSLASPGLSNGTKARSKSRRSKSSGSSGRLTFNDAQKQAIEAGSGIYRVSAGPGSGKTRVAVERIVRLIHDGVNPQNIIATTFTKKAAGEMNNRLEEYGINSVTVQTMHSFCFRMLRREGVYDGWEVDDVGRYGFILKDITGWKGMKWQGVDLTVVEEFISNCKNSLVRPDASNGFGGFVDRRYSEAYFRAEERRQMSRIVTFDDMLIDGVELLQQDRTARERYQNLFEWVLVDEFQDSNLAQLALTDLLAAPQWNLMVIGDVDQCHPPGTKILTDCGERNIEALKNGDIIKGWNRNAQKMIGGRTVRVGVRDYSGDMITVRANGRSVSMTPDHKVLTRWSDRTDRKTCAVYLMYREDRGYRIGWCQLLSNGANTFHLKQRAKIEKAEKTWILEVTKDRTEASVLESIYSVRFGIPTSTFEPVYGATHLTEETIKRIFDATRDNELGTEILESFNLHVELPLLPFPEQIIGGKSEDEVRFRRSTYIPVYAANVIPGVMSIPLPDDRNTWAVVEEKSVKHYIGPVYSLDVETDHAYSANGIVVLNCIFEWRGAKPQFMVEFNQAHEKCNTITMGINYRCAPNIVHHAAKCIENNEHRITKDLSANRDKDGIILIRETPDLDAEADVVADEVELLTVDGVEYKDMMILYRTNAQSRAIEEVFSRRKIPFVIYGSISFYERKEVQDILSYLRLLDDPRDVMAGERAINRPFRFIGRMVLDQITDKAKDVGDFVQAADELGRAGKGGSRILEFVDLMHNLRRIENDSKPSELMQVIVEQTDYINYLRESEGSDTMESSREDNIGEAIRSAGRFNTVSEFLKFVKFQIGQRKKKKPKNAVQCMTVHRAKGLESDAVFIIGANQGIIPHAKADDPYEEERRLFYVAMTRAMRFLHISSVESLGNAQLAPSQFIQEAGLLQKTETKGNKTIRSEIKLDDSRRGGLFPRGDIAVLHAEETGMDGPYDGELDIDDELY